MAEHLMERLALWRAAPVQAFDSHLGGYEAALLAALALPLVRKLSRALVFEPAGRRLMYSHLKKTDSRAKLEDALNKWNESCWKGAFYLCIVCLAVAVAWNEKWLRDTRYFWLGCTRFPPCNYEVPLLMRLLYALELGFYAQAVPYLMFWEVRRRDFWQNFAHHLATIGLIVYSYEVNFMKIGTAVFLCHDVNDIFLESAKLARYARRERAASGLFGLFVASWLASRIAYFPLQVIRSAWSEPLTIIAHVYNISPHPHHEIFLALLLFLFALHIYWTYLILRIAVRQLATGSARDIREEDDDDD